MRKNHSWSESFGHALDGIRNTARRERNFRIQTAAAILAIALCAIFRVEMWQFMLVVTAIFFVLAMELVNSAVEAAVDLSCGGRLHPLAKIAKDAAAGAVLLAAAFAVVVGVVVAVDVVQSFLQ